MDPLPSSKQTLSFLMERFREVGIHPRTKFGQNFLIDLNLLHILVEAADLTPDDVILEVGTGTGSLTALMAPRVASVVTVEIDDQMFQLASEELYTHENVVMFHGDALKRKNLFNPDLLDLVRTQLDAAPNRRFKLVANLPYSVATPIISNLMAEELTPHSMTVTIQKELADRITASPSTKDYSALSIWLQSQSQTKILRELPPSVFWPRPKVNSAFIQITTDEVLRQRIRDRSFWHTFLRALFIHRRKFLRAQLFFAMKDQLDKTQIDEVLAQLNMEPSLRAEQIPVEQLLLLCHTIQDKLLS